MMKDELKKAQDQLTQAKIDNERKEREQKEREKEEKEKEKNANKKTKKEDSDDDDKDKRDRERFYKKLRIQANTARMLTGKTKDGKQIYGRILHESVVTMFPDRDDYDRVTAWKHEVTGFEKPHLNELNLFKGDIAECKAVMEQIRNDEQPSWAVVAPSCIRQIMKTIAGLLQTRQKNARIKYKEDKIVKWYHQLGSMLNELLKAVYDHKDIRTDTTANIETSQTKEQVERNSWLLALDDDEPKQDAKTIPTPPPPPETVDTDNTEGKGNDAPKVPDTTRTTRNKEEQRRKKNKNKIKPPTDE
jgi:hypothetical protein